jgi:crotonobetainyl-CoA:carnitine CoA-transferase CaiB-like acyl-CoA transferase
VNAGGQPYADVRILDLGGLTSAYGTRLLAALGAEVVVPEPPAGSPLRRWEPFAPHVEPPEASLWWAYFAQGKRSVVVDDDATWRRLVAGADVVIEAGGDGPLAALRPAAPPSGIWVSVTPFGSTGPKHDWKGSELVAWASCGLLHAVGFPDGPPMLPAGPVQLAHHFTALHVALGIQLALRARRRTGRGQPIEVSMQEVCLAVSTETGAPGYLDDLVPRMRSGNRRATTRPWGLYPCVDGYASLVVLQPAHWRAMAQWIAEDTGQTAILDDAFNDIAVRWEAAEYVDDLTEQITRARTKAQLFEQAQGRGIPCTPVNTVADLRHDAHLAAAGFWHTGHHPALGEITTPGAPIGWQPDWWKLRRAPLLGEHTDEVLDHLA